MTGELTKSKKTVLGIEENINMEGNYGNQRWYRYSKMCKKGHRRN